MHFYRFWRKKKVLPVHVPPSVFDSVSTKFKIAIVDNDYFSKRLSLHVFICHKFFYLCRWYLTIALFLRVLKFQKVFFCLKKIRTSTERVRRVQHLINRIWKLYDFCRWNNKITRIFSIIKIIIRKAFLVSYVLQLFLLRNHKWISNFI